MVATDKKFYELNWIKKIIHLNVLYILNCLFNLKSEMY